MCSPFHALAGLLGSAWELASARSWAPALDRPPASGQALARRLSELADCWAAAEQEARGGSRPRGIPFDACDPVLRQAGAIRGTLITIAVRGPDRPEALGRLAPDYLAVCKRLLDLSATWAGGTAEDNDGSAQWSGAVGGIGTGGRWLTPDTLVPPPLPDTREGQLKLVERLRDRLKGDVAKAGQHGRGVRIDAPGVVRAALRGELRCDYYLPTLGPLWAVVLADHPGRLPPFPGEPETAAGAMQALDALAECLRPAEDAKRVRRKRRRAARKPTPLTPGQTEAVYLVGEHKGNVTAAAAAAGKTRQAMKKLYDKAMKKLGKRAIDHATQRLPTDRRGQETVAAPDEE